jgi:hypothetical protein
MLKKENVPALFRAIASLLFYTRRKKIMRVEKFRDQDPIQVHSFIDIAGKNPRIRVVHIRSLEP